MSLPGITHTRLLDTATELFYAEGIAATGVDKVVARSGVSKPTLYAHFRSKDELVAAVLEKENMVYEIKVLARDGSTYEINVDTMTVTVISEHLTDNQSSLHKKQNSH